jgi:hypothetical protein
VETVLSEWENDGIESAMKIYNFKENEQVEDSMDVSENIFKL